MVWEVISLLTSLLLRYVVVTFVSQRWSRRIDLGEVGTYHASWDVRLFRDENVPSSNPTMHCNAFSNRLPQKLLV